MSPSELSKSIADLRQSAEEDRQKTARGFAEFAGLIKGLDSRISDLDVRHGLISLSAGLRHELQPEHKPEGHRPALAFAELLNDVTQEAARQDAEHGWQSKLDLLGRPGSVLMREHLATAEEYSRFNQSHHNHSFLDLLVEELSEAARETDPERMEAELVQLATLALGWAQASRETRGAP